MIIKLKKCWISIKILKLFNIIAVNFLDFTKYDFLIYQNLFVKFTDIQKNDIKSENIITVVQTLKCI